jgi:septum formation protein
MLRLQTGERLILASSSPRRRELLGACGLKFDILNPAMDETLVEGEHASQMVMRLALGKARRISYDHPSAWVLGADTSVVADGNILGKPADTEEARNMLRSLSDREHDVYGGIAICNQSRGVNEVILRTTRVKFAALDEGFIQDYVGSGEPMDKAGAYAIQGAASLFIESISGSYSNVVGFDMNAVFSLLCKHNVIERVLDKA